MSSFNDFPEMKPLFKVKIPQTWSSAQALCIVDFLNAVADNIWDCYERPILDLMDRRSQPPYDPNGNREPEPSYKNTDFDEDDLPF